MRRLDVDVAFLNEFLKIEAKNETTLSSRHYLDDYRDFESKASPSSRHDVVRLSRSLCPVSFPLWPWCWLPFETKEVFGTSEKAGVWFTNDIASDEGTQL